VHLIFTILSLAFAGDGEPILDLQRLLNGVDDRPAAYDFRIDYTAAPRSALSETDAAWADVFLRQRRSIARSRDV
jgi:hypothetical protein